MPAPRILYTYLDNYLVKRLHRVGLNGNIFVIRRYHDATIDSVDNDEVSVLFDDQKIGVPVVLTQEFLKELPKGQDRGGARGIFKARCVFHFVSIHFLHSKV